MMYMDRLLLNFDNDSKCNGIAHFHEVILVDAWVGRWGAEVPFWREGGMVENAHTLLG